MSFEETRAIIHARLSAEGDAFADCFLHHDEIKAELSGEEFYDKIKKDFSLSDFVTEEDIEDIAEIEVEFPGPKDSTFLEQKMIAKRVERELREARRQEWKETEELLKKKHKEDVEKSALDEFWNELESI